MDKIRRTNPRTKTSGAARFFRILLVIILGIVMLMLGYLLAGILEILLNYR